MKTFKNIAAQGDLLLIRVSDLPTDGLKKVVNENTHTIAHSETGHNHVMSAETVDYYDVIDDEFTGFISVSEPTELTHLRSFDTHESLIVPAGLYKIKRQREYVAEGFRRAAD